MDTPEIVNKKLLDFEYGNGEFQELSLYTTETQLNYEKKQVMK